MGSQFRVSARLLNLLTGAAILVLGLAADSLSAAAVKKDEVYFTSLKEATDEVFSPRGISMSDYITGTQWRYGKEWGPEKRRSLTLAAKYCFDRVTGTPYTGKLLWKKGETVYPDAGLDLHVAFDRRKIGQGYHEFSYPLQKGVQVPISKWVAAGEVLAVHHEQEDMNNFPVIGENGDPVIGAIDPARWGRWCYYHGVEFHSATLDADTPNSSPCGLTRLDREGTLNYDFTYWLGYCEFCGEAINTGYNIYAPKEAVAELPMVEIGQEYVLTCPHCGGLEQTQSFSHTCRGVSPNRYFVVYDINTDDSAAYGKTAGSSWLTDFAAVYEGESVSALGSRFIAESGFSRKGYVFKGWAISPNGEAVYFPGDLLLSLQKKGDGSWREDKAVITLYAVWEPTRGTLVIDAESENIWKNTTAVWLQNQQSEVSDTRAWDYQNPPSRDILINENTLRLPDGYTVTFHANGGVCDVLSVTAKTHCSSYTYQTSIQGRIENVRMNSSLEGFTYRYAPGNYTDTILLQYEQEPITLPSAYKEGKAFVGWYLVKDSTLGNEYAGREGDLYLPGGNITLYATYTDFDLDVKEAYYKLRGGAEGFENSTDVNDYSTPNNSALAIQNATGAVSLRLQITENPANTAIYKIYWGTEEKNVRNEFNSTAGRAGMTMPAVNIAAYKEDAYVIKSSGYYRITAIGERGADFNETYTGGAGGAISAIYYFHAGDTLSWKVNVGGGQGSALNEAGTKTLNGGGYTEVSLMPKKTADKILMFVAGGGGAAVVDKNGENGGITAVGAARANGGNGMAGGGGGALGGSAGSWVYHQHSVPGQDGSYVGQTSGCYKWDAGRHYGYVSSTSSSCSHWGHWCDHYLPDGSQAHFCDQGCWGPGASGYTCDVCGRWAIHGSSQTKYYYTCRDCGASLGESSSHMHPAAWGLWCTKTPGKTIDISYVSYGGANYINTNIPSHPVSNIKSTGINVSYDEQYKKAVKNGDTKSAAFLSGGCVMIESVQTGFLDASENKVEIIGAFMPDVSAPSEIPNIFLDRFHKQVTWKEPESNGTDYFFRAERYLADSYDEASAERGLKLLQETAVVKRTLESAIAGYYYLCDDAGNTDIKKLLSGESGYSWEENSFTWSGHRITSRKIMFTQSKKLALQEGFSFLHLAAVDAAGNIGPSSHLDIRGLWGNEDVGTVIFNTNRMEYQFSPQKTVKYVDEALSGVHPPYVQAPGANIEGYFVAKYYAVGGSSLSGTKGIYRLSEGVTEEYKTFGGPFPTVSAAGASFVGWNTEPDGTGIWYHETALGKGDGASPETAAELVMAEQESFDKTNPAKNYSVTCTLYAIWGDRTSADISVEYAKQPLLPATGVAVAGNILLSQAKSNTITSGCTEWTSKVDVLVSGKSPATGIYRITQSSLGGEEELFTAGTTTQRYEKSTLRGETFYGGG